jgi:hypothetical protein
MVIWTHHFHPPMEAAVAQAVSACITLIFTLTASAWACQNLLEMFDRNSEKTLALWRAEYNAHLCGRALSGIANVHGASAEAVKRHPRDKRMILATELYIKRNISSRYDTEFKMTSDHCFDLNSNSLLAEVYLRNSDESTTEEPNYGYRITQLERP